MKNYFTEDDDKLRWSVGECKDLLNTRVFNVHSYNNTSSTGVQGEYIVMDAPEWIIVIPEIEGKFVMVKQWRHGLKDLSIEFPGGVVDEDEEPLHAAIRELQEETGYKAGIIEELATMNPNPALYSNHVHIFLAKDLKKISNQDLDNDEFINILELPIEEVINAIGTKQFPHAIMGTALALYLRKNR